MAMLDRLVSLADRLAPRWLEIRRHLHSHPELSGHEQQTAAYLAGVLSAQGLTVREGVGKTGLVGELAGEGSDDRCLGVRVDMDALPIREQVALPFASRYDGVMHACGHDIHATVGLGAAMLLSQLCQNEPLPGTTRFLFQPAEEIAQGARWMVADGAIAGLDALLGVHVFPEIPAGKVGIRYGAFTAAVDELEIVIEGEAGHGARPHEAIDAIWLAAQVVTQLQQAIARCQNPLRPVVLTIGKIQGGRAPNVIADRVVLTGMVRSLDAETAAALPDWIERIVAGICDPHGGRYQVHYGQGVPVLYNDPDLTQLVESAAREAIGDQRVQLLPEPSLGSEDFSVYLQQVPGTMFRLGVGASDRPNYPLHHPKFQPDEQAIATGAIVLAYAIWKYWQP